MKVLIATLAAVFGLAGQAAAQAVPGSGLGWDQQAATLAAAQGFTYSYSIDSGAYTNITTAITCVTGAATTPPTFGCRTTLPTVTEGSHTITLRATSAGGTSLPSMPLTFTFSLQQVPSVPGNIQILPPPPPGE